MVPGLLRHAEEPRHERVAQLARHGRARMGDQCLAEQPDAADGLARDGGADVRDNGLLERLPPLEGFDEDRLLAQGHDAPAHLARVVATRRLEVFRVDVGGGQAVRRRGQHPVGEGVVRDAARRVVAHR